MANSRFTFSRAWLRRQLSLRDWKLFWTAELPVITALALALPIPSYYTQHDAYDYISEMWPVWGMFVLCGLAVMTLYHLTLRRPMARLVAAASALMMLMMDFDKRSEANVGLVGAVFPGSQKLVVFVALLLLCWMFGWAVQRVTGLWKRWHEPQAIRACQLLVAGVLITNCFYLGEYLMRHWTALEYQPKSSLTSTKLTINGQARDVYYLLFDRYASNDTLQKDYNYDDSDFLNALKAQGFTLRDNAYSNYQFTAPSIASTLRMDYLGDLQTDLGGSTASSYMPYRRILENSPVSQLFASAGYAVTRLSSWYGVTRTDSDGATVDPQFELTLFGQHFFLSDLQSLMLDRTFLSGWFRAGVRLGPLQLASLNNTNTGQLVLDQLSYLRQAAATPHSKPNFIFAHILSPHPQYVFLPDGSKPTYDADDDDSGAPRQLKYVNQLKFLNSQILTTIQQIKASSKVPPVIIIQADEGPYPPEFHDFNQGEDGPFAWDKASADTLKYKFGILAAYDLPGVSDEDKAQLNSSVNAFRFVFNHYLGANFAYLPDCSFVFDGTKPFDFYDITTKLHGSEDDACAGYADMGSLK